MNRLAIGPNARGLLIAIAFVALALVGLSLRRPAPHVQATKKAVIPASSEAPEGTFDAAVAGSKRQRKVAEMMAEGAPGSWSRRAAASSAEMGYAQLTGDYEGYYAADRSLTEAFRIARTSLDDDAVGPLLLKSQLDYELHRLKPALASLRVPEQQAEFFHDQKLLAEITSLRGAITFALGSYDDGLGMMRRSIQLDPTPGHKQRLAIALSKVGSDAEALRIFDETSSGPKPPRSMAWIELQRAKVALEHGRRDEGRAHLEKAKGLFPGFWQTEEHLAELDAEEGHTDRAIASYRALVTRTGDPEFMDALARLIADRDPAEAQHLRERSNALYDDRLVRLPEASYGHALEHFLQMAPAGENPARAVEIAEKNRDLRPNGEARTRLAQAYVKAGRLREAREEITKVTSSAWTSAESYATAALILRLSGADASKMEAKALAINSRALEEIDWLAPGRT